MLNRTRPFLDIERIISLLASTDWTNPSLIDKFEKDFAETINALKAFAINQGRSALLLALKSLNIGSGGEVIVQSLICQVVIDAILEIGATPVLVDNSLDDYQVSPIEIKKKITSKTKAIIAAHLYGIPCQIEEISAIAKENNCYLIEDCAHSLGAQYNGKKVGTYGDLAFFSFNFDKPISVGNGGMLVVNNPELINNVEGVLKNYQRMTLQEEKEIIYGFILQHLLTQKDVYRQLLPITFGESLIKSNPPLFSMLDNLLKEKNLSEVKIARKFFDYLEDSGLLPQQVSRSIFRKSFSRAKALLKRVFPAKLPQMNRVDRVDLLMNSLRALIGLEQLKHLDSINHVRNRNAAYLSDRLNGSLYRLPKIGAERAPTFLRYTVLNQTGLPLSEISKVAEDEGLEISNYNWSNPVHLIEPYRRILSYDRDALKNSEQIAHHLLNIPIHFYIEENELKSMIAVLNTFGR